MRTGLESRSARSRMIWL